MLNKMKEKLSEVYSIYHFDKKLISEAEGEMLQTNLFRAFVLSLIYIPIRLIQVMLHLQNNYLVRENEVLWRNEKIQIHIMLFLLIIALAVLSHILWRKQSKAFFIKAVVAVAVSVVTISMGIFYTIIDQKVSVNSITPFLVACTIVSMFFLMSPLYSFLVYLFAYFLLISIMKSFQTDELNVLLIQEKAITVVIINFCMSFVLWIGYMNNFKQKLHIAEQKKILELKNGELIESNEIKNKLFTILSHDIRQPLASILNLTELLEEIRQMDPEYYEIISHIKKQMNNSFSLVDNLLDWCRHQNEGFLYRPEKVKLIDLVDDNLLMILPQANLKEIRIINDLEKNSELIVYVDREMMNLVIRNLLSNAIKYTPRGGLIQIDSEQSMYAAILVIKDNGIGIDESRMEKLFVAKNRMLSTIGTEGERGTGLGLHLCGEFVQKNKGDIWANSLVGEGSAFYISMPSKQNINIL